MNNTRCILYFQVVRYFEFSPQRNSILTSIIDASDASKKTLKQLCRTRWVERISSYESFWDLFCEVWLNKRKVIHKISKST